MALLVLVALALSAVNASAVIVQVHEQKASYPLGYQPVPQTEAHAGPQLNGPQANRPSKAGNRPAEYHGGPVMASNTNYTIYWDPAGAGEYPAGYETGIDRWFEDLAHDSGGNENTDSVLTQYGDSAGEHANYASHFAGTLTDTDPYPANGCTAAPVCLTDAQLRTEIVKYLETNKLPADLQHEYFVITPSGIESCFEAASKSCSAGTKHAAYCAYHGYIPADKGVIVYANVPYMQGTNCDFGEEHPNDNASDATLAGGLVEEHSEAITDPELNAWYDSKGEEVGDKCRHFNATEYGEPLGKAPDGSDYNQIIDGDLYLYHQYWSNQTEACEQRTAPSPPTVTKIALKSGTQAGGTQVTITGTNFAKETTVRFGTIAASQVTINSSTSITAVSPAGAAGAVDITVTTAAGTSAINKKDRFKYK